VLEIRAEYAAGGTSCMKLAAKHGITDDGIWRIIARKNWKHI
jgi:hypothetical protein